MYTSFAGHHPLLYCVFDAFPLIIIVHVGYGMVVLCKPRILCLSLPSYPFDCILTVLSTLGGGFDGFGQELLKVKRVKFSKFMLAGDAFFIEVSEGLELIFFVQ